MKPHRREHLAGSMIVWIAQVSKARDSLVFLEPCLDGRDRERAARFRFAEDRARFVLGRGLLRKCLGRYLEQTPETIELATTDRGRPVLPHDETVQFSISHTHDLVAVALTADARIGIDLEHMKLPPDLPDLAKRILSEEDFQAFQALPGSETPAAFYRAWTRKEAYLKARGEGIAEGLRQISVSLGPEKTGVIRDARDKTAEQTWRLLALPVPADYVGSLACDDAGKRLECAFIHLDKSEVVGDSCSH
ncbi:MAG TPA: 4'-phosphopantetheinyl transferase superfamily protein [Candidatus Methylacidiphilales bacterium]|jgi:4'-phosphopantetheinyl transferase|nr:4'-phosphopantetheinyl transferase superfamily protein [Candidatus Methylacidiphilales bacterium]